MPQQENTNVIAVDFGKKERVDIPVEKKQNEHKSAEKKEYEVPVSLVPLWVDTRLWSTRRRQSGEAFEWFKKKQAMGIDIYPTLPSEQWRFMLMINVPPIILEATQRANNSDQDSQNSIAT